MKNKYIFIAIFSIVFLVGGFLANNVSATVGGPIFINDFKYNPQDESVYYIYNSYSGRGCPPELKKMSLTSGQSQVAFSCEEGEKILEGSNFDGSLVGAAINKITSNFSNLILINLKKNNIAVDVNFVDYKKYGPMPDAIDRANFLASVYQNDKKVAEFPISGCNLDQPFIFAGYAIPGFDKKIVLLLSAKGDCREGGYTYENLYVVGGVDNLDKNFLSNYYKENSALAPNEGTLVVFEADKVENKISEVCSTNSSDKNIDNPTVIGLKSIYVYLIGAIMAIVLFLVGILIGRLSIKKAE